MVVVMIDTLTPKSSANRMPAMAPATGVAARSSTRFARGAISGLVRPPYVAGVAFAATRQTLDEWVRF